MIVFRGAIALKRLLVHLLNVGIQLVQLKLNLYDMISITVQKKLRPERGFPAHRKAELCTVIERIQSLKVEKRSRSLHFSEKTGSAAKVDLD
jgi:hypothetical protein